MTDREAEDEEQVYADWQAGMPSRQTSRERAAAGPMTDDVVAADEPDETEEVCELRDKITEVLSLLTEYSRTLDDPAALRRLLEGLYSF